MYDLIASPTLIPRLDRQKYCRWAGSLDADTLDAALWAVGDFGRRYRAMRKPDGRFPAPVFRKDHAGNPQRLHVAEEGRMRDALVYLALVSATGRLDGNAWPGWGPEFSSDRPAFSRHYRDHLSRDPRTAWSQNVDERTFAWILFMTGVYGIRANLTLGRDGNDDCPDFGGPAHEQQPMRRALRLLQAVTSSARVTPAEAAGIMEGAGV